MSPEGRPLGSVLDPIVAAMNHSCIPNAFVFGEGHQLRVRSLRPLTAGEEVTISYVDRAFAAAIRHEELETKYFFKCKCKALTVRREGSRCTS